MLSENLGKRSPKVNKTCKITERKSKKRKAYRKKKLKSEFDLLEYGKKKQEKKSLP